jgi:hypothetical protein
VSFKAKSETPTRSEEDSSSKVLTQEDQAALSFVHQLKQQFDKAEFDQVLIILQAMADDKKKIELVVKNINSLT